MSTFDTLVAALRGEIVDTIDWHKVIGMANHALVSPEVYAALHKSGKLEVVPADVRDYLALIHEKNRERNVRLRSQLFEATEVFNRDGIKPVLLKGAVPLFLSGDGDLPTRMTSDLDVAVEENEMERALACLASIGYLPADDFRGMGRSRDVGLFELRAVHASARREEEVVTLREGVEALIPSATARAEHWILHDVIKEGDFVRGRVDLRHLFDLAVLAEQFEVDWPSLRAARSNPSDLLALDTQLYALHSLFQVRVPDEVLHRATIRFHHWRRIFPARHRIAGIPLRLMGNLAWSGYRARRLGRLLRRGPLEAIRRGARLVTELNPRAKL